MGIIRPSNEDFRDNGLYKNPNSSPMTIYSFEKNFKDIPDERYDYAYRIYIYEADDFKEGVRSTDISLGWEEMYAQLDVPNSKSGSYVVRLSDADFTKTDSVKEELPVNGQYYMEYVLYTVDFMQDGRPYSQHISSCYYFFSVIENHYPLKKNTILDVINRVCETVEPLRYGQKPRFRLQGVTYDSETGSANGYIKGTIAEKLDKILAPEFAFTKMNLREMLQQVGGYIHGEPRVYNIGGLDSITQQDIYFEFTFDNLGGGEKAYTKKNYVTATFGTDINEYCTSLDSSVENITNQLSYAQGVMASPFYGEQGISLRVENTATRIQENNQSYIPTALPINQLGGDFKLYCTYIPGYGKKNLDITPYVFEEADYQNLSSYEGTFPYCKAYAIYYTQGQKHIRGLFFKEPDAINSYFEYYSIVNILAQSMGVSSREVRDNVIGQHSKIAFRVEYNPIFKERIRANKPVLTSGLPRTIAYNQSANLVESRYLGENLKGVVARLGNVEKTYTYNLAFMSDIPSAGMRFDDNYIISAVSTKFLPTYIQVTVALSKNFNRKSNYVAVDSNKRMWEVSEKQAQQRETVITDYFVFNKGATEETHDAKVYMGISLSTLLRPNYFKKPISAVNVFRWSKKGNQLTTKITLPVISCSMGNSMSFTFGFEDNYSAGQSITHRTRTVGSNTYNDFWSNCVPYNDYYGRFYYLGFEMLAGEIFGATTSSVTTSALSLPVGEALGVQVVHAHELEESIKYRKDSREIPQITYEIQAVSTSEDLIIGSALMRNCSLVNMSSDNLLLVLFDESLNVINSNLRDLYFNNKVFEIDVDFSNDILLSAYSMSIPKQTLDHKSWAIITAPTEKSITVEDEDGEVSPQKIFLGCELVIGGNYKLDQEENIVSMLKKSKIYD